MQPSIPESFEIALERVIWVRTSFTERLSQAGVKIDAKSDERHSHFVSVLERVRETLKPLMPEWTTKATKVRQSFREVSGKSKGHQTPLSNLFEVLDVYEPSVTFENAPAVTIPTPDVNNYTVDEGEDDSLFEAIFAMTTLMSDLSHLRREVADLWAEYEDGAIDLAAVSVATETAIEFGRSFEDQIKPLIQRQGGTAVFHNLYWNAVSKALGIDTEDKKKAR